MRIKILLRVALAVVIMVATSAQPARAADCGALGWLLGCDKEEQHIEAMAAIDVQQQEIVAQQQIAQQQIEYQKYLATEQAQAEIARIAADERVSMAEIQARLETANLAALTRAQEVAAMERMNSLSATTSFNVAALQGQALERLAGANVVTSYVYQTISLVVLLIMLAVSGALAYVVTQYRRVAETRAKVQLLEGGELWQRRAVALLEERQLPWRWEGENIVAQVGCEVLRITDNEGRD